MDLIHRDSADSPFYNPHETPAQRINHAARRSVARVHRFSNIIHHIIELNDPDALLTANNGEYLVNISLGTPPFPIVAIADTGSDIIWTQCKPCTNCYKQDAAVFDPKSSTTYRKVLFPKTIIGCGHDNAGTFDPKGSGIVGLGGGSASLVSQLGSSIAGKFSYCLVPYTSTNPTSTMNFGTKAIVSGSNVVSTALISDPSQPTFYFLELEAVSVGSKKIPFQASPIGRSGGNIIIDSGTTLTLVPSQFFSALSDAVESQVTGGTKASDPQGFFSLCYVEKIMCLAFYANDELSIYGNVAQQNFLIGYDLQKHTISFKPTDCSKTN
ncbi:Aspartic proteinase CDR1 [Linum grandiflorum]